jgi:hypothetical protein
MIPNDPDVLLRRSQTAQALTESGFPVKVATLATKASRGGGPPKSLKRDKVGIEVLIIGKRGESAIPAVDTKPETARSLARQWRTPSLETGP